MPGGPGAVKVGYGKSGRKRRKELQPGNPYRLRWYAKFSVDSQRAAIHLERWGQYALRPYKQCAGLPDALGEWFWIAPENAVALVTDAAVALYDFDQERGVYLNRLGDYSNPPWYVAQNKAHLAAINADPEHRARISAALRASHKSNAHLAAMHADPEYCARRDTQLASLNASPEGKARLAALNASRSGRPMPEETKAKRHAARTTTINTARVAAGLSPLPERITQ